MQNHPKMFQHENARPHTARICTAFLADAGIDVMDLPAKFPDLNPVENVCSVIRSRSETAIIIPPPTEGTWKN